jgi:hypothetical protein
MYVRTCARAHACACARLASGSIAHQRWPSLLLRYAARRTILCAARTAAARQAHVNETMYQLARMWNGRDERSSPPAKQEEAATLVQVRTPASPRA